MSPFRRRLSLPALTLSAILLLGLLAAFAMYGQEEEKLAADAEARLGQFTRQTGTAFDGLFAPTRSITEMLGDAGLYDRPADEAERLFFALTGNPVRRLPQVDGIYLGFPDGSFLQAQQFVPLPVAAAAGDSLDPQMGTRRQLHRSASGRATDRWLYYRHGADDWSVATLTAETYDPRERPWYRAALDSDRAIWTAPYLFASTGALGVTYATRLPRRDGSIWAVLGIDLAIETLSQILARQQTALAGDGSLVFATSTADAIIGHPQLALRSRADIATALQDFGRPGSIERAIVDALPEAGAIRRIRFGAADYIVSRADTDAEAAMPLHIYLAQNLGTVTAAARRDLQRNIGLLLAATIVLGAIIAYAVKLRVEMAARRRAECELVIARDEAEAATRAKSNFLATMSHEIRTPMNGVMSMAEMFDLTRLNSEQRRMTKVIRDSAQALLTVINDILDFSKIEAGKLEIETVAFSLADTVDGVGELLAPRADEKMLDLVVDIDPALADVRLGDPTRLRQVLLNLGGNAVKFTHDGSVRIAVQALADQAGWLRFEIQDSGIGLTPHQMQRLFKPFEQADSSTARQYGGTGLGLSICQRLCTMMGGRIGVESTAGQGSVFWFELPLPAADRPAPISPDLSALRVLMVGLPAVQQAAAQRYLAALPAARIAAASTLAEAGRIMADTGFDLVMIDARCPDGALQAPAALGETLVYALLAPRSLISGIDAAARTPFSLALTYPLSAAAIARAAGIALGQVASGAAAAAWREDMAYAPPDLDAARAARAVILVAEDNATNRLVIQQLLSRMGYACEIADNGAAALALYERALYERKPYGLLLTDFHMPAMDGFELTAHIRAIEADAAEAAQAGGKPAPSPLPIIALTADALTGTEQQCLEAGMDGYLTKPVNSRALAAALQRWLPQALPLRRPATVDAAGDEQETSGWDTDVFDPTPLTETFGHFDDEARQLLRDFIDDAALRIDAIIQTAHDGDLDALRELAHALKGGARSVGIRRLGNAASDLQDACDAADAATAAVMAERLAPALDELRAILPSILKLQDEPA